MAAGKLLQCLQNEAVVMRTQALELSLEGRKEEAVKKLSSAIDRNPTLAEYHVFRCLSTLFLCATVVASVGTVSPIIFCITYIVEAVFTVSWATSIVLRKTSTRLSTSVGCPRTTPLSSWLFASLRSCTMTWPCQCSGQ